MLKILSSESDWVAVAALLSGVAVLVPSLLALIVAIFAVVGELL